MKDEDIEALQDDFDRAEEHPWDAKEFPVVAEWLAVNEKPLALIVAASRRANCYFPFVVGDAEPPLLGGLLLPQVHYFREAAQLLVVKAMLQTKQGNIEGAWENLKACHRLARLAVKGSTMVDALVGFAVDGMAVNGDVAFSHYAHLTTRQAEQMKAELSAFPPVGDIVDKLDTGERFLCLDATASIARKGMSKLNEIGTGSKTQKSTAWLDDFVDHIVDWNIPFKIVNRWYDRLVAAGRITDQQRRRDACAAINKDLIELSTDLKSLRSLIFEFFKKKTPEELVGSRMGASIVLLFLPALDAGLNAQDRVDLCSQMDLTAFALATFRADHGEYPTKLDLLVPKYIDKIPIDTFSRNSVPIRYRRDGDAYLMWTVHIDGVDDDGRSVEDDPPGDDHVLRPVPKLKTK